MKYKYEFVNETVEIEVDDGWEKLLEEMDYEEALNEGENRYMRTGILTGSKIRTSISRKKPWNVI